MIFDLFLLVIFLAIVLLILNAFGVVKIPQLAAKPSHGEGEQQKTQGINIEAYVKALNERLITIEDSHRMLKSQIEALELKIAALEKDSGGNLSAKKTKSSTDPVAPTQPQTPTSQKRKAYVQRSGEASFADAELRDSMNKFVKFELDIDGNRAAYIVARDSENQQRILNTFGDISNFVDKENESDDATGIETTKAGLLELSGGQWIVTRKAVIRFVK